MSSSYSARFDGNGNGTIVVNNQSSSENTAASRKPGNAAIVPQPKVFVADAGNCASQATLPNAPAQNVVVEPGSANKFRVNVAEIDLIRVQQKTRTLCWAACTQILLRQQKIVVDQDELAQQYISTTDGENREGQAAGLGVMIRALNPDLQTKVDARGTIPVDFIPLTSDQMLAELMANHLCIVGLVKQGTAMGHACVVCGASFSRLQPSAMSNQNVKIVVNNSTNSHAANAYRSSLMPQFGLHQVELFDPRTKSRFPMSGQEFQDQVVFLTSCQFAREVLLEALHAAPTAHPDPNAIMINSR